jgi:cell division protease FtsH
MIFNKNYRNFFLWTGAVALIATAVGSLVPSGPVHPAKNTAIVRGATHTVSNKNLSPPAKTADTAPSAQNQNSTVPVNSVEKPSTVTAAPAQDSAPTSMSYQKLKQLLETQPESVARFAFDNNNDSVTVMRANGTKFVVTLPDTDAKVELRKRADELKIDYDIKPADKPAPQVVAVPVSSGSGGGLGTQLLLFGGLMILGIFVSMFLQRWMQNKASGGGFGGGFAKSKDKDVKALGDRIEKVTFDDVAGCDEAVAELRRTVKSLVSKGVYGDFDGELPKGILLVGPPGTGKTLLAKAVAYESGGQMSTMAGSDFVEMLVGVGAARVRDLFEKARKTVAETGKPYVIFIDEFDAIGGKRGASPMKGGNSEQENTLNALLVEMDGVEGNKGILILAATNRVDMLDEALLRQGRFDAQVAVDLPDIAGREKIFGIHTRKKKLAADVSHAILATRTFGYSGADIKGICNRAAIIAADRWIADAEKLKAEGKSEQEIAALLPKEIKLTDFDEGIDFVKLGGAKTGSQSRMPEEEKLNTAHHEGGHALVAAALKDADPVVKITIMRRARALGYVQYMPNSDRFSFTDKQAIARIICAMAGRAAQEVYLNRVDTGASNDFEQACDMARAMVTKWGMSRLGRIAVGERGAGITGYGNGGNQAYGDKLANEIDVEWRRIVETCYQIAKYIVTVEKARMEQLVKELMAQETILTPRWKEFLKEIPSAVDAERVAFDAAAPAVEGESHAG